MINETLAASPRSDASRGIDPGYYSSSSEPRAIGDTLLSWFAFAAVVMGVIGAINGAMTAGRRRPSSWRARGDRYELTPPHGDKLHSQF